MGSQEECDALGERVRAVTAGYVLACERDDGARLRLVVAVRGARRHEIARRALHDLIELLRGFDVAGVDLTLLDPDDATVEQKHQLVGAAA